MPGAFKEQFRFSRHTAIYILNFNESRLLVNFASLAELYRIRTYLTHCSYIFRITNHILCDCFIL